MADIKTQKHDAIVLSSQGEKDFQRAFSSCSGRASTRDEILPNLGLFLSSKALSRVLFFYEIYKKILNTHGVVMEFGVRWGQTLSVLSALRGIFEPFNRLQDHRNRHVRRLQRHQRQRRGDMQDRGRLVSVSAHYEQYLESLLGLQEALNPIRI